jgi:hypothetical protein
VLALALLPRRRSEEGPTTEASSTSPPLTSSEEKKKVGAATTELAGSSVFLEREARETIDGERAIEREGEVVNREARASC